MTAYLAAEGYLPQLVRELELAGAVVITVRGRLVLVQGVPLDPLPAWAANVWLNPRWIGIDSISDAAAKLKAIQRNWHLHPVELHRRAGLIQAKLPYVSARPQVFGAPAPAAPLGSWTLWDASTILAAATCSSPWPDGAARFVEDRVNPPGRAYLKLWEAFTRLGVAPGPGELCLDLGSAPGGWSWVLAGLGARVFSVDKADLDPRVARLPNVEHCRGSAFGLDPRHTGPVDWLCSDVICYPERLYALLERWLELGEARNILLTIKFQAETDFEASARFRAVPGARLIHLFHNKHELTFARLSSN